MSLLVLVAPPNVIGSYSDSRGNVAVLDATGRVQVNTAVFALAELLEAGFSLPADVAGAVPFSTLPVIEPVDVSVAVTDSTPAVFSVIVKMCTPASPVTKV